MVNHSSITIITLTVTLKANKLIHTNRNVETTALVIKIAAKPYTNTQNS